MWGWLLTYGVAFLLFGSALLVAVEVATRWASRLGSSHRYVSRRWVREINSR